MSLVMSILIFKYSDLYQAFQQGTDKISYNISNTYHSHIIPLFEIETISIKNREFTPLPLIEAELYKQDLNLLKLSNVDLNKDLAEIAWIKKSIVQKKYPRELIIKLEERKPKGRWQHDGIFYIIDAEGVLLDKAEKDSWDNLILFAGTNANHNAKTLLDHLNQFPDLLDQVVSANWIANRRWDLYLNNGMMIRLAPKNIPAQFEILSELSTQNNIFNKDIKNIDLRLPGKLILKTEKNILFSNKSAKTL